ncbi:hypothetical protein E2C01_001026 [Portunus trituberculatus]|uniref:Uncharacterized protein n=1 Tax=Portunus trituberculatus TaxID=210409 RepID=A0A5B7CFV8_PORTR|nr:hypothetical protein [Portunus trituberculatus]
MEVGAEEEGRRVWEVVGKKEEKERLAVDTGGRKRDSRVSIRKRDVAEGGAGAEETTEEIMIEVQVLEEGEEH